MAVDGPPRRAAGPTPGAVHDVPVVTWSPAAAGLYTPVDPQTEDDDATGQPAGPAATGDDPPGGAQRSATAPLDLDELLTQLIDRAGDVRTAQHRLQALLRADQAIIGDLTLPVVLRRIVVAARQLVGARYAALGVVSPARDRLDAFVQDGIDEPTAWRIGHLPTGHGLLGALLEDPRPIRLDRLADDARASGFPEHHPPMTSFLGVPIRVRDDVVGNLYLTDATAGTFTADDERLLTALAATAGVAIENARLFAQAEHRQRWLEATSTVTRQLLDVDSGDPLELIAHQVHDLAEADLVTVILPTDDPGRLRVHAAAGERADAVTGFTYAREESLAGETLDSGIVTNLPDALNDVDHFVHQTEVLPIGPVMVLPLAGKGRPRGVLMVGRVVGRPRFDAADVAMAGAFANQAALALEIADTRADQQRVALLEDRDRIARDLHDHVIQRLFAVGLTVQGLASTSRDATVAARLSKVIDDIDTTIAQIRTSVFALQHPHTDQPASVQRQVLDVVSEVEGLLHRAPDVRFDGPLDSAVPDVVTGDLLATLREALTNVARHADARAVDVTVWVEGDTLALRVTDDGVGMGAATRRSGLANLARRAARHGGTLDVTPGRAPDGAQMGTRLTWTIPLS